MHRLTLLFLPLLLSAATPDELRDALRNRVESGRKAVGIIVGTITPEGRSVIASGKTTRDGNTPLDGDSIFEIGSVTKVFTSLLLADMVERGEVTLDTPVAKLLPGVTIPSRDGKEITLLDLSMQVSGLPRLPNNMRPADAMNPYADYDATRLYEFLARCQLTRPIGEKYEYSNLGVGLLGHALARKSGMSYEALLRKRIFEPLGMSSTTITLTPELQKRLALGHNPALAPVKNWDLDALAGAGAIRSSVNDMLKFLAAAMEVTDTPLKPAFRRMRSQRRGTGTADLDIQMAWHVFTKFGTEIVWHNGGTGGYRSFVGFAPASQSGIVVLCNTSFAVDDIGRHFLEPKWPLDSFQPPTARKEVTVDPKILATYAGEYQLAPEFVINVTVDGAHIYAQASGQPRVELFAESETEFFLKVAETQVSFVKDDTGKITHLVLHQSGAHQKAMKR